MADKNTSNTSTQSDGAAGLPGKGQANGFGAGPLPGVGAPKRWVTTQPVVLALVLFVSIAMLLAMRSYGVRSGINFKSSTVDYSHEASADQTNRFERIMQDLARVQNPLDVRMTSIGKDPFTKEAANKRVTVEPTTLDDLPVTPAGQVESEEVKAARVRALEKVDLLAKVGRYQLHSVMTGKRPLARIDDLTVEMGDVIDEMFTVVNIDKRSVVLSAKGHQFTLMMEQDKQNTGKKPRK